MVLGCSQPWSQLGLMQNRSTAPSGPRSNGWKPCRLPESPRRRQSRARVVSHFVPVNDASVIPPSQYQRRVRDMEAFVAQFEDEVEGSHGELTKKAERLRDKIDSKRDVASLAGSVGSTNVASALALLPDGRVKKERYFPSVTLEAPPSL